MICTENPTGVIVREGRLEGAGETVVGRICETGGFLSQKWKRREINLNLLTAP